MSGKSPRISSGRPSPRKLPLYSPSERSPFSFNEDTLKILATDLDKQNGMIPCKLLQPRYFQCSRLYVRAEQRSQLDNCFNVLFNFISSPLFSVNIPAAPSNFSGNAVPGKCFSQPQTPSEERRSFVPGKFHGIHANIFIITLESFSTRRVPSSPSSSSTSFFPLPPSNSSFKGGLSHSHSFGSQLTSQSVGASNIGTQGLICQQYQVFASVLEKITFSNN